MCLPASCKSSTTEESQQYPTAAAANARGTGQLITAAAASTLPGVMALVTAPQLLAVPHVREVCSPSTAIKLAAAAACAASCAACQLGGLEGESCSCTVHGTLPAVVLPAAAAPQVLGFEAAVDQLLTAARGWSTADPDP